MKKINKKKIGGFVVAVSLVLTTPALAQDVRSLSMGGVLTPGSSLVAYNPAYLAYNAPEYASGFTLPLGLLNFFVRPQMNLFPLLSGDTTTFKNNFDGLAFLDQAMHLNTFIFNPARSPEKIVVELGASGIQFLDAQGNPININWNSGVGPIGGVAPVLALPLQYENFGFGIGLYTNIGNPSFSIDPALAGALASGVGTPNKRYTIDVQEKAEASLKLNFSYATAIELPEVKLYVGGRGNGFYGLAFIDATASAVFTTDANGKFVSTTPTYETNGFAAFPGNGGGYGVGADLGVAADVQGVTVGLGVVDAVNFSSWNGTQYLGPPDGTGTQSQITRSSFTANPLFTLNLAYNATLKELGADMPGAVLFAADAQVGRGGFAMHAGAEAQFGFVLARAGFGYSGGLAFGVGGGFDFGPVGLDVALTAHNVVIVNSTSFGIAAALRFK